MRAILIFANILLAGIIALGASQWLGESSDTGLFAVANAPAMTTARMTTAATRVRMDLRFICFSLLKKFES